MGSRCSDLALASLLIVLAGTGPGLPAQEPRLESVQQEIDRLDRELRALAAREAGVLGEIERLGAELRLRVAQAEALRIRLARTERGIEEHRRTLAELAEAREVARDYLEFRLREIYKRGPEGTLRSFTADRAASEDWRGLRYAAWLSERDARTLAHYREASAAQQEEAERLTAARDDLVRRRAELRRASRRLDAARRARESLLATIRDDRQRRGEALSELQRAAAELSRIASTVRGQAPLQLDVRKFRGLIDPPAVGPVSARFGHVVHPRFKTSVPHPGWDIDAPEGADIRAVFDGHVVFASWLRGYGLTVILDHGHAVLSVYAHAAVLVVEEGESVTRGDALGKVGDTGSLRGPFLYFEMREGGEPVDPAGWIRPR